MKDYLARTGRQLFELENQLLQNYSVPLPDRVELEDNFEPVEKDKLSPYCQRVDNTSQFVKDFLNSDLCRQAREQVVRYDLLKETLSFYIEQARLIEHQEYNQQLDLMSKLLRLKARTETIQASTRKFLDQETSYQKRKAAQRVI